ncbi:hypothetical protein [Nannocystis sp.]|uniref:hypothetical protein n=1 Tax=Nannocystis sp. TaxID=1962667 RepID=UPI00242077BE|nr:hypothetical protein [Nannocystis sp.]MBK7825868.1 hypothetical protein [Nannocystis sp.]MBK9755593.1 hypothetical protein [Nannocystis sp.]
MSLVYTSDTPVRDPYLVRRLDHPLLGDAYLATLLASGAAFAVAGWGLLMGLLCGIALGVPAIALCAFVLHRLARHDPRGLRSRLLTCLTLGSVVATVTVLWVGLPGLLIGAALAALTGARALIRDRSVFKDRPLAGPDDAPAIAPRPGA